MKALKTLFMTGLLGISSAANAQIIDFINLTQTGGGFGESAWTSLVLPFTGGSITVSASSTTDNDATQYAYLDWGNAGLGVCNDLTSGSTADVKNSGSTSNLCDPSSDDNVTTGESLALLFDTAVKIERIWFNNSHDNGFNQESGESAGDDLINIEGGTYAPATDPNGFYVGDLSAGEFAGPYIIGAGDTLDISFNNEQFYVSGLEFSVIPEPTALALIAIGLLGLSLRQQYLKKAQ